MQAAYADLVPCSHLGGGRAGVCHVVAAGPQLGASLRPAEGDFVIAADAGYLHCREAGVLPGLLIGDDDSLGAGACVAAQVERVRLPVDKDDTDTVAAFKAGLERGWRRFAVHAALGGDVGHEVANMQALLFLREHGADGVLVGAGQRVHCVVPADGERAFSAQPGERVSVFAFGQAARGVSERGLRWELSGAVLEPGFPLGVSNRATGPLVRIGVREGALLVAIGSPR